MVERMILIGLMVKEEASLIPLHLDIGIMPITILLLHTLEMDILEEMENF